MLKKFCGCGQKISISESKCFECLEKESQRYKLYDETKRKFSNVYRDPRWRILVKECKEKCWGLDWYQLFINKQIIKGEIVHHIVPVEDSAELWWVQTNLILVSRKTHKLLHDLYNDSDAVKNKTINLLQKTLLN